MSRAEPTEALDHPRACPDCGGFGVWRGDRAGSELIVECVTEGCTQEWTAPDRTETESEDEETDREVTDR